MKNVMCAIVMAMALFCGGMTAAAQSTPDQPRDAVPVQMAGSNATIGTAIVGEWSFNGNGFPGTLRITSMTGEGHIAGTVYGQAIYGFWDETSKRISFVRVINIFDPHAQQIFTGFLLTGPDSNPLTLAGSFERFASTGAFPARPLYGWYAQKR